MPEMAGKDWTGLENARNSRNVWNLLNMAGDGWKRMKWQKMAENGLKWLERAEIVGNGWKRL